MSDAEILKDIEDKIKSSCSVSKYTHLCSRISTEAGLANVTNRCLDMMSKDHMRLSAALAQLELEYEGAS